MSKILGLDLGVSSIGWAVIEEKDKKSSILGMGVRIIPLSKDDADEFTKGNKISKNQNRTQKRTQRKGYDRYQLRRYTLTSELKQKGMLPDEQLIKLPQQALWELRAKARTQHVSLQQLGRVLYHLNQKRGYKSSRLEENIDKKQTDYVQEIIVRDSRLIAENLTIGQYFYQKLLKDSNTRVKDEIFSRSTYMFEFDEILKEQQKHYPSVLTAQFIHRLRNEIIYFQRKLKSQKGLVSVCEFESRKHVKEGKTILVGPRVAPRSSPLAQVCKIWETINSIRITNKKGEILEISLEQKQKLFQYLDNSEKMSESELFKLLKLDKKEYAGNQQTEKGIQGNTTKAKLIKKLSGIKEIENLLQFQLNTTTFEYTDKTTGELITRLKVDASFEQEPLYKLWHSIYSISDIEECKNALIQIFGFDNAIASDLAKLDFTLQGFSNKSSRFMRKIIPYLAEGLIYSEAAKMAGYNHSNSLTTEENIQRVLLEKLPLLEKNSLRQPIVEKILNQTINVVNAILEKYGTMDEIRVELARELKQSKDERNKAVLNITKREKENEKHAKLIEEMGIRATKNNIQKYRFYKEINNEDSKLNAICIYCGKPIGITEALSGDQVDIEHIIPKSMLFDDSQQNKTLSHRKCNQDKGGKTAFEYMSQKSKDEFDAYLERVDLLFKSKIISKGKKDKLLMPANKIPNDFIERQLRETQYIAKKAKQLLEQVCHHVHSTSGSVTAHLRNLWGWNDVLMNLNIEKFKEAGLTEIQEKQDKTGVIHKKEIIKDWSKRDDHRHHAIDALTIACTKQGFIQKLNELNSKHSQQEMFDYVQQSGNTFNKKFSNFDNYILSNKPFSTAEIEEEAAKILISYKPGKKVASIGSRKVKVSGKKIKVQEGIVIPRGALSEESVYGKIKVMNKNMPLKDLFNDPENIVSPKIKALIQERILQFNGDAKKAFASVKKEPIYLDKENTQLLSYGSLFGIETVLKYAISSIKEKDLKDVVDDKIRLLLKQRIDSVGEKDAFKEPLYTDANRKIQIKSVRIKTGLDSVVPIRKNENNEPIAFVKPGNNHHMAFYKDIDGKFVPHICSFWHAVERKKYKLPVVIQEPQKVWDAIFENPEKFPEEFTQKLPNDKWEFVMSLQQNEMFILGFDKSEFENLYQNKNYVELSKHLYRLQKLSIIGYGVINIWFRLQTETNLVDDKESKSMKRFYNFQSINSFLSENPIKVKINTLGEMFL